MAAKIVVSKASKKRILFENWQFFCTLQLLALVAVAAAEPSLYGYGLGYYGPRLPYLRPYYLDGAPAVHPGGAVSSVARSVQGIGKRSADAEPEADAGYLGYGYGLPAYGYGLRSYGYGLRPYGYGARSYEYRSPQGLSGYRYKREAEADADAGYLGYGYGLPAYGYGLRSYGYGLRPYGYGARSYEYRSPQGLRYKREADAEPGFSFQSVARALPYGGISQYGVETAGYAGNVYDRRRTPLTGYGYGFWAY